MPLIQVFIATYNRPTLVLNAIQSALNQDFDSFEVIVSDNSTNNETEILISKINNELLSYKRRRPSLPAIDHFNAILQDVTSDYFIIFHDDDVMCKNMINLLVTEIGKNKNTVAVGANAFVVINNKLQKNLIHKRISNQIIKNRTELAKNYLTNSNVPFSSYLYKKKIAKNLFLDKKNGGKHSDVSFLMNVCDSGNVINLKSPVMYYYFHKNQDSNHFDYFAISSLTNYIIKTTDYSRKDKDILKFRALHLYSITLIKIKNSFYPIFGWRNRKIISIMLKIYPLNYFFKLSIKIFLYRLQNLMINLL